jgi:nucleotidyltransferase substrate binding protein (TIGR01987 family)
MASDEQIKNLFGQFKKALQRLTEALQADDSFAMKQDAVIQRFEFTYELLWKTYKRIARFQMMDCFGPKDAFKVAFKLGLIADEKLFLDIIDARNKTTHIYAEDQANKIYDFIRHKVLAAFESAADTLESDLKTERYR